MGSWSLWKGRWGRWRLRCMCNGGEPLYKYALPISRDGDVTRSTMWRMGAFSSQTSPLLRLPSPPHTHSPLRAHKAKEQPPRRPVGRRGPLPNSPQPSAAIKILGRGWTLTTTWTRCLRWAFRHLITHVDRGTGSEEAGHGHVDVLDRGMGSFPRVLGALARHLAKCTRGVFLTIPSQSGQHRCGLGAR